MRRGFGWVGLLLLLAGCVGDPVTPTEPTSLWGRIFTVGQAEQIDAPLIWPDTQQVVMAWIGADETGVHQDIRAVRADGLSEKVVLPLPPVHPYAQQFAASLANTLHLLWLDANPNNETRLYSAIVTTNLELDRGPTLVSEQAARRYTSIPAGDGALWTISAGGLLAEPGLYVRYLDLVGRPQIRESYELVSDADWPTVTQRNDGTVDVFWIQNSTGKIFHATFADGVLENPRELLTTVTLNPGDRLDNFSAALDDTHSYLFWNISRADGQAESWFASAVLDSPKWSAPVRLGVVTAGDSSFQTGFNTGAAHSAQAGDPAVAWVRPLAGQFDVLPLAGVLEKTRLVMLYLRGGDIVAAQDIAPIHLPLSAPNLTSDRDRHLYLAWSQPNDSGSADLNLTMTRTLGK